MTDAVVGLKELELHLLFVNLVFSNVLWLLKVLTLVIVILGGSSAIRIIHISPVLGLLYGSIAFTVLIGFIGMFQFAYKVTEKVEELMECMKVKSASVVNGQERRYWKRILESFPRMGMRLGGFNRVEREAVPIFMDFSVKQIFGILISFK